MADTIKFYNMDNNAKQKTKCENREPFVGLYTKEYLKIRSFIHTLIPNHADAEDVLQAAASYMWENFNDFDINSNFLAWAITMAKYQVMAFRKKQSRSRIVFYDEAIELIAEQNQKLHSDIDLRNDALKLCLSKLPSKETSLISMRFREGKSIVEIADLIDLSLNATYKRFSRIKAMLLKCVQNTTSIILKEEL